MEYERTFTKLKLEDNKIGKKDQPANGTSKEVDEPAQLVNRSYNKNTKQVQLVNYDIEDGSTIQFPASFLKILEKSLYLYGHQNAITSQVILSDISLNLDNVCNIFQSIGFSFKDYASQSVADIFNEIDQGIESLVAKNVKDYGSLIDLIPKSHIEIPNDITDEKMVCLIIYTNIGFAYCYYRLILYNEKINLFEIPLCEAIPENTNYILYVSDEKYLLLNKFVSPIQYRYPLTDHHPKEKDANEILVLVDFDIVNGEWQPKFNNYALSEAIKNISKGDYEKISNDGTIFSFDNNDITKAQGFIGQYSEIIKNLATGIEKKPKEGEIDNGLNGRTQEVLRSFRHDRPAIITSQFPLCLVFIAYLPNDLKPTDPLVADAAQYMYMLMRRCSIATFVIPTPEEKENIQYQADNTIHNVSKSAKMHGHGKSLIFEEKKIMRHENFNGSGFINFDSIFDFLDWEQWTGIVCNLNSLQVFEPDKDKIKDKHDRVYNYYPIKKETIEFLRNTIYTEKLPLKEKLFQADIDISQEENIEELFNKELDTISKIFAPVLAISQSRRHFCKRCCGCATYTEKEVCPVCFVEVGKAINPAMGKEMLEQEKIINLKWAKLETLYKEKDKFFVKWFMKYWVKASMLAYWNEIQDYNLLRIPKEKLNAIRLKYAETIFVNDMDPQNGEELTDAINVSDVMKFVDDMIAASEIPDDKSGLGEFEKLKKVIMLYPINIDINTNVHKKYRLELLQNAVFGLRYNKEEFSNLSLEEEFKPSKTIKAVNIIETDDRKIRVNICEGGNRILFQSFIFKRPICDDSEKFASQPLRAEAISTLSTQPNEIQIIDSWNVSSGVLILALANMCLKLGFLAEGETRPCPHFVGNLTETFDEKTQDIFADFAEDSRTFCYAITKKERPSGSTESVDTINVIQILGNFSSFTTLMSRSVSFLRNVCFGRGFVTGLKIDTSGNFCMLGLINSRDHHQYALFDIKNKLMLSTVQLIQKASNGSAVPVTIYQREDENYCYIINMLDGREGSKLCKTVSVYKNESESVDFETSDSESISLINIHDMHCIVSHGKNTSLLKLKQKLKSIDSFSSAGSLNYASFDIEGCAKFAADSIINYGMSEIDRLPSIIERYALEAMRIALYLPYEGDEDVASKKQKLFVDTVKKLLGHSINFPIDIPFYIQPFEITEERRCISNKVMFQSVPSARNYDQWLLPPMMRITGMPLVWTHARTGVHAAKRNSSLLRDLSAHAIMKFPQMGYLRASNDQLAMSTSFCDLFGSDSGNILSALSGLPFMSLPNGSISVGSTFVPIHIEEMVEHEEDEDEGENEEVENGEEEHNEEENEEVENGEEEHNEEENGEEEENGGEENDKEQNEEEDGKEKVNVESDFIPIQRTLGKTDKGITAENPNTSNYIKIDENFCMYHPIFAHIKQAMPDTLETAAIALFTALTSAEVVVVSIGSNLNGFVAAVKHLVASFDELTRLTGRYIVAERMALLADFGSFPLATGERLSSMIGYITSGVPRLQIILFRAIAYIPTNQPVINIARNIYTVLFLGYVEFDNRGPQKVPYNKMSCGQAMSDLQEAAGMFTALNETAII